MTGKWDGRIGDTPIIGAGEWDPDRECRICGRHAHPSCMQTACITWVAVCGQPFAAAHTSITSSSLNVPTGNYACPDVAVSGTGIGEQFMRHVVAHDVAARLMYKPGSSLQQAVQEVVQGVLQPGDGGVIAVDR